MKSFFKENFALAAGIILPLVLMGVFLIAGHSIKASIADPTYSFVFASNYYPRAKNRFWTVEIENGNIVITKNLLEEDEDIEEQDYYDHAPELYVFDHKSMKTRNLHIDFTTVQNGRVRSKTLDEFNKNKFITTPVSPDGYTVDNAPPSRGTGLIGEIFGLRQNYYNLALVKKPRIIPIYGHFYMTHFLAWIDHKDGE